MPNCKLDTPLGKGNIRIFKESGKESVRDSRYLRYYDTNRIRGVIFKVIVSIQMLLKHLHLELSLGENED
jgi:hypothetical protein